jgi:hypothetical protein
MKIDLPDIGYVEIDTKTGETDLVITNVERFSDEQRIGADIWPVLYNKYRYCLVTEKLGLDLAADFKAMYAGYAVDTQSRYIVEAKNAGIPDAMIYGHTYPVEGK